MLCLTRSLAAWFLLVAPLASARAANYAPLLARVPAGANVLVLIDVEQLLGTPLAAKQGWREKYEAQFRDGLVIVPPRTGQFVLAAQLEIPSMLPAWESWVMDLKYVPDEKRLAEVSGGSLDSFSGLPAVRLSDALYAVKFKPTLAGLHWPGNRQQVARWVAQTQNAGGALTKYLTEAVGFAQGGSPIIVALDLENAMSAEGIQAKLAESDTFKGQKADLAALAKQFATIRGVSLGITVEQTRFGKIKIDFAEPVTIAPELAKALLLEVLGNHGVMIDEFEEWKCAVSGKQVTLEGTLLTGGMRRILSLLDAPPSLQTEAARMGAPQPGDERGQTIAASQEYFRSVATLVDDLRRKKSTSEFVTFGQIGAWFERYARHIDRLPIVNVDPDLLQYGSWVANSLRDAEKSLKGIGPTSRIAQQNVPTQYNVNTAYVPIGSTWAGNYGAYAWNATVDNRRTGQEKAKVRTQARIEGNLSANLIMQGLDQATGDICKHLTQKYQVEFALPQTKLP